MLGDQDILDHGRRASCAGSAATSCPTSRRTRHPRSTRHCGSACSCVRCSRRTAQDATRTMTSGIAEMMREVALSDDPAYLRRYPHELSGGQQQRVGLAMAFANRPRLIVLDEPTTGLDVTTQATVLSTVRDLAAAHGVAALYVSHDLAVVAAAGPPGRGHVLRTHRRARPRRRAVRVLRPPVHPPAGRRDPAADRRSQPASAFLGMHRRRAGAHRAAPSRRAARLHIPRMRRGGSRHWHRSHPSTARGASAAARGPRPSAGEGRATPSTSRRSTQSLPCSPSTTSSARYGKIEVLHSINLTARASRVPGRRRRVGLRQDHHRPVDRRPAPRLDRAASGSATRSWRRPRGRASTESRRQIQYIFQNPYGSLNPRKTDRRDRRPAAGRLRHRQGRDADSRVGEMLEQVSLSAQLRAALPRPALRR